MADIQFIVDLVCFVVVVFVVDVKVAYAWTWWRDASRGSAGEVCLCVSAIMCGMVWCVCACERVSESDCNVLNSVVAETFYIFRLFYRCAIDV